MIKGTVVKAPVVKDTVFKDTVARHTVAQAIPALMPGRRPLALAARAGRQYSPRKRSGAR